MRIEFSVSGPAGRCDVAVSAPASTPVSELLPALAALAGAEPGVPARLGARTLSGRLAECGLRTGAVVSFGAAASGERSGGLHAVHVVGGSPASDAVPLRRDALVVGREPGCDLVLDDERVSRRHAELRAGPAGVTVHDLGSTNTTSVDGVPVPAAGRLVDSGAIIRIGDSLLTLAAPHPPPSAALMRGAEGSVQVNRAPRRTGAQRPAVIERAEPGRVAAPARVQWFAALAPAVAGGLLAWLFASPMFLLFALLSPLPLLGTAAGDRLHWRRERRSAAVAARRRHAVVAEQAEAALAAETAARRAASPDPATVVRIATQPGHRLWERQADDPDHLVVRIGSADLESATTVRDPTGSAPAGVVPAVPVIVHLRDGPIGVAGSGPAVSDVARWTVAQLATLHAPADLELVLVLGPEADDWQWCRWLPHLRTAPPSDRDNGTTLASLAALRDRRRAASSGPPSSRGWSGRWIVVVADRLVGSELAASAALLADGPVHGITGICLAASAAGLPAACRTVAVADTSSHCRLSVRSATDELVAPADRITTTWAERIARGLAPLTDARGGVTLPKDCRWGDLVAVEDLDAVLRTQADSDGGARVVLGRCRDGPIALDLVADGPHALVAGTTGAGKSELLRTLLLGLAVGHPPDEVSFLLVDYKGGAAFAEAARLPHTTGVLTDLDASLTGRALLSLHAELRRREQLFAAAGVDDLAGYRARRRGASSLARLVIVVDEFAELAADLPDFVTGLVGVARRGRSLGVHLVLATQRPGSAVSADIRANTAIRICLRVTEPTESADVIGVPDAALLDPGVPGRCYARLGDRLIELQAARVVPDAAESQPVVEPLGPWRRPARYDSTPAGSDSELRRVVDLLVGAAQVSGSAAPHAPWLPPLPARLPLSELDPTGAPPLGRLDHPTEPAQPVFGLDPAGDAVLVVGRARSGRTVTLVTAAVAAPRRSPPTELQLHVLDGGGELARTLAGLPHLGTCATRDELELVPRLLERLLTRRRPSTPRSLLLVDDWDLVVGGQDDAVAAGWTELLAAVVRTTGPDLTVLVAGGRSLLVPRLAAGFASRLVLPLADPTDYGMAGVPPSAVPTTPSPGGGVRVPDGTAFRIAHAGAEPTIDAARPAVEDVAEQWAGAEPAGGLRLRTLPAHVPLAAVARSTDGITLGLAGDTADPCVLDVVGRRARLLVAGPARSGRTTVLLTAASEARRLGLDVKIVAPPRSPLREHARALETVAREPPRRPTLLLVDDVETCDESVTDALVDWLRDTAVPVGVLVAGRTDELVTSYRGLVAEVRRERCGLLLRPSGLDGELLGVRVRPPVGVAPPGRGVVVGDPRWGPLFDGSEPVPIQVAHP